MNRPDDEAKPQTAEAGSNALEERDTLSETARLNLLAETSTAQKYDTKCGVCSRRCCSPCLADGDISRCAQTRFKHCRVCGHFSSSHYAALH